MAGRGNGATGVTIGVIIDLNGWLVRQGYAAAYRKYSLDYVPQEEAARKERLGMWSGRFVMPWLWRRGKRL